MALPATDPDADVSSVVLVLLLFPHPLKPNNKVIPTVDIP